MHSGISSCVNLSCNSSPFAAPGTVTAAVMAQPTQPTADDAAAGAAAGTVHRDSLARVSSGALRGAARTSPHGSTQHDSSHHTRTKAKTTDDDGSIIINISPAAGEAVSGSSAGSLGYGLSMDALHKQFGRLAHHVSSYIPFTSASAEAHARSKAMEKLRYEAAKDVHSIALREWDAAYRHAKQLKHGQPGYWHAMLDLDITYYRRNLAGKAKRYSQAQPDLVQLANNNVREARRARDSERLLIKVTNLMAIEQVAHELAKEHNWALRNAKADAKVAHMSDDALAVQTADRLASVAAEAADHAKKVHTTVLKALTDTAPPLWSFEQNPEVLELKKMYEKHYSA